MGRRRVSVPHLLLGIVLVLALALAGAVIGERLDTRVPVLATSRAIAAGQIISSDDLRVVRVAADTSVVTVPAAQLSTVVGRSAAVPLAAHSLLAPTQLGAVSWPPVGQALIAVAVKPGRSPSGLGAGAHVKVLVAGAGGAGTLAADGTAGPIRQAEATVVSVEPAADQSGQLVVSLVLAADAAAGIAAASGDVSLVQLGVGG